MRKSAAFASLLATVVLLAGSCGCTQYKVGDLDAWGVPPQSKPDLYAQWSKANHFALGDSLLFLYPPSEDSVMQVTARAFAGCATSDPVLKLDDGNSWFNLTSPGRFYFTSGVPGHCEKGQKLAVDVPLANGTFFPPPAGGDLGAAAPGPAADGPAATFRPAFGPSAAQSSGAGGAVAWRGRAAGVGSAVAAAVLVSLGLL